MRWVKRGVHGGKAGLGRGELPEAPTPLPGVEREAG